MKLKTVRKSDYKPIIKTNPLNDRKKYMTLVRKASEKPAEENSHLAEEPSLSISNCEIEKHSSEMLYVIGHVRHVMDDSFKKAPHSFSYFNSTEEAKRFWNSLPEEILVETKDSIKRFFFRY